MRRIETLNINNTYRSLNNNAEYRPVNSIVKVNTQTEPSILNSLNKADSLIEDTRRYIIYHSIAENDNITQELINKGAQVDYYTSTIVPTKVATDLNNNKRARAIYPLQQQFSLTTLQNMSMVSMLTRIAVDCPIVYPDIKPKDILFPMFDARYLVDRIELSFPNLHKSELGDRGDYYSLNKDTGLYQLKRVHKLNYYLALHEYLARWKIRLHLICDSQEEANYILKRGEEIVNGKVKANG